MIIKRLKALNASKKHKEMDAICFISFYLLTVSLKTLCVNQLLKPNSMSLVLYVENV